MKSRMNPRMTQSHAQPDTPLTGLYTRTYINVVKGKNVIPRMGKSFVSWNAIVTRSVNNQTKIPARRGKAIAHNAKTRPKRMIDSLPILVGLDFEESLCSSMQGNATSFPFTLCTDPDFYMAENSIEYSS
jgi:hypothetical protein